MLRQINSYGAPPLLSHFCSDDEDHYIGCNVRRYEPLNNEKLKLRRLFIEAVLIPAAFFSGTVYAEETKGNWTPLTPDSVFQGAWEIFLKDGDSAKNSIASNSSFKRIDLFENNQDLEKGGVGKDLISTNLKLTKNFEGNDYSLRLLGDSYSFSSKYLSDGNREVPLTIQTTIDLGKNSLGLKKIDYSQVFIDYDKDDFSDKLVREILKLDPYLTVQDQHRKKAYLKKIELEPIKVLNINGEENSQLSIHLDKWDKGIAIQGRAQFDWNIGAILIERETGNSVANAGLYVYSNSYWESESEIGSREKNNELTFKSNEFAITGNIHRAITMQGHNSLTVDTKKLVIDTTVTYAPGFTSKASYNGHLVGNGSIFLHGSDGISLIGNSTDIEDKRFKESFVIRGGDVDEDSCTNCTRHWDTDFTLKSENQIEIDSNWGAIYMKSDTAKRKGEEADFYAKAVLDAKYISIRAAGTSEDQQTNASFKAISDNSAEASITLGKGNTDTLSVNYTNTNVNTEKKHDFFYASGANAKISLNAKNIYINNHFSGENTTADVRTVFFADDQSKIEAQGKIVMSGNTVAKDGGQVNLTLKEDPSQDDPRKKFSTINGAMYDNSFPSQQGITSSNNAGTITISGTSGSTWNVKPYSESAERGTIFDNAISSSMVSHLAGAGSTKENPFTVDLTQGRSTSIARTTPLPNQSLYVTKLDGDFVKFNLRFDDKNGAASGLPNGRDTVLIHEGSGKHGIFVHYEGDHGSDEAESLREAWLVSDNSQTADFVLSNPDAKVDIGLYKYELASEEGDSQLSNGQKAKYWYLKRTGADTENPEEPGKPDEPEITPGCDTEISFAGAQRYLHWTDLQDLRKRLGEVRYGSQSGVWARAIAQKDLTEGEYGSSGLKQKYYGVNFGADTITSVSEDHMWLMGANVNLGQAKQETRANNNGSGETDKYGLNLYATWASNMGSYADFVLSADYFKQEVTTRANQVAQKGKYDTFGLGASVEVGKQFSFESNDYTWGPWYRHTWIEPQLQLAYYWLGGKDYRLSNKGIRIHLEDDDSLIARAGVVIGSKWNYGENYFAIDKNYVQVQLKGGVKHDFLGDYNVALNDRVFSDDIGKTTFYYGAGVDWQANDKTRIYLQAEREEGNNYTKEYEVSVGVKYQF